MSSPPPSPSPPQPSQRISLLFRLTAIAAALFIVTILALVALLLGETHSPAAIWLDRNAIPLIAVEVIAILVLGFAAMADDRRRTLNEGDNRAHTTDETTTDEPV